MTSNLTVVVGDFSGTDRLTGQAIAQWVKAGLLKDVAFGSLPTLSAEPVAAVQWMGVETDEPVNLFSVLESRIWDHVTFAVLRSGNLTQEPATRFVSELATWNSIQNVFGAHRKLILRGITVSICDQENIAEPAFNQYFDAHILHEPRTYTDIAVASKPLDNESRALVVALLALGIAGAFKWQAKPEVWEIDPPQNGESQLRVGRILMRAVTAGRLADEILRGAFPESGPWAVPPDVGNSQAVPPGTWVDDLTIKKFIDAYLFTIQPWNPPKIGNKDKDVGILAGFKLFLGEFIEALKGFPDEIRNRIKEKVEAFAQNVTFGNDSAVRLKFDPQKDLADPSATLEVIRELRLSAGAPVNDPTQWESLAKFCLSSVDGGEFPEKVAAPVRGPKRLVYVDPTVIGPSLDDASFTVSPIERDVLDLPDEYSSIGSLDVLKAQGFALHMQNLRTEMLQEKKEYVAPAKNSEEEKELVEKTESDTPSNDPTRHRTSHAKFDRHEYVPLTAFYQGPRADVAEEYATSQVRYKSCIDSYSIAAGFWKESRSCDHCGTAFHHGLLYVHEPTNEIVHVGHVCARKILPLPEEHQLIQKKLHDLELRWRDWLGKRSGSILWRTRGGIESGIKASRSELAEAIKNFEQQPAVMEEEKIARKKLARWTRRGFLVFMVMLAASFASVIFTAIPIFIVFGTTASYLFGLIIRLVHIARDLARAKFRREKAISKYEASVEIAQHAIIELERLNAVYEQFEDWQLILREIAHRPFGAGGSFESSNKGMESVARPASFVLATAKPSDEQLLSALLQAKKQTIHAGWLSDIYKIQRRVWEKAYQLSCLTGAGDNLDPEADNAPSHAIRAKRPITNEDVFYPRADFRFNLCGGKLSDQLIKEKAQIIAEDLARMRISDLLGSVEVVGEGRALNGRPIDKFLGDLLEFESPNFDPDLFADGFPELRKENIEKKLPLNPPDTGSTFGVVRPGEELTAAVLRIDLSGAISGKKLRGWVQTTFGGPSGEEEDDEEIEV